MITIETAGATGYLVLDRPDALNALSLEMIGQIQEGLDRHLANDAVRQIVVRSAKTGVFCVGGDVKHIRQLVLQGEQEKAAEFFNTEYALNLAIAQCAKPWLSIIDGVAMGGGIGISAHGSHRIVTQRALLSMPETAIGLFPDVGGSYFLPRLAKRSGYWLGLTAARIDGVQAVAVGLGTEYMSSDRIPGFLQELENGEDIDKALAKCVESARDEQFDQQLGDIERVFSASNLEEVRQRLSNAMDASPENPLLSAASKGMEKGSPNSLMVTLELLKAGARMSVGECLDQEYDAVTRIIQHPDFVEGVRAVLVDKDHRPAWL